MIRLESVSPRHPSQRVDAEALALKQSVELLLTHMPPYHTLVCVESPCTVRKFVYNMPTMNFADLKARLAADKGNWSQIARGTGLHINAVRKIAIGETPTPRISTVERLAAYYAAKDAELDHRPRVAA